MFGTRVGNSGCIEHPVTGLIGEGCSVMLEYAVCNHLTVNAFRGFWTSKRSISPELKPLSFNLGSRLVKQQTELVGNLDDLYLQTFQLGVDSNGFKAVSPDLHLGLIQSWSRTQLPVALVKMA